MKTQICQAPIIGLKKKHTVSFHRKAGEGRELGRGVGKRGGRADAKLAFGREGGGLGH